MIGQNHQIMVENNQKVDFHTSRRLRRAHAFLLARSDLSRVWPLQDAVFAYDENEGAPEMQQEAIDFSAGSSDDLRYYGELLVFDVGHMSHFSVKLLYLMGGHL